LKIRRAEWMLEGVKARSQVNVSRKQLPKRKKLLKKKIANLQHDDNG
jgi:hypothetical protein